MIDKIKEIIADKLNVDIEQITAESRIKEDLGADSLDTVELVMALEEETGHDIDDETAIELVTVGDIIRYLENLQ